MPKNLFIFILFIFSFCFHPLLLFEEEDIIGNNIKTNMTIQDKNIFDDNYNITELEYEDVHKYLNLTNIILFDDSNYTLLNKSDLSFILFYSDYCHHCHKFMPTFIETANYCHKKKLKIVFAIIDANINNKASEEYEIKSYPTVYFILKGKRFKYKGKRTKKSLINFMYKK